MDKKPYRNAIRSKAMIRAAFIELLAEKPLEKITVVDIVNRSDLSRNTFYAHYQDVFAVLEEFQAEALQRLRNVLEAAMEEHVFDDPLWVLRQAAQYVDDNKQTFRTLLRAGGTESLITCIKNLLLEYVFADLAQTGIKDQKGFSLFIEVLTTGFIHMFELYLRDETDMTSEAIALEINRMFLAGLPLYR